MAAALVLIVCGMSLVGHAPITASRIAGRATVRMEKEFTAAQLREAGFSATKLKAAAFSAEQMREAGYTAKELVDANFTAEQLVDAGFSEEDLFANMLLRPSRVSELDTTQAKALGLTESQARRLQPIKKLWREAPGSARGRASDDEVSHDRGWGDRPPPSRER